LLGHYFNDCNYYKNNEHKDLILSNILNLPNEIIITIYKYNKIYLKESLKNNLENKIINLPLEISSNLIEKFYYQDYIENEINKYNGTIKSNFIEPKYDLVYKSRYMNLQVIDEYGFTNKIISQDKNNVIIMDFLLFNKNFLIRYDQVEWLFNYCRIRNLSRCDLSNTNTKTNANTNITLDNFYCVDGWVCSSDSRFFEYKIYWDEQLLNSLGPKELAGYDHETKLSNIKLSIEMFLIIGSNCPVEILNLNNYLTIKEWYLDNKEYFDIKNFDEFYKINKKKKLFYTQQKINKIKTNFVNNIESIPKNLIKWTSEFVKNYLSNDNNIKTKTKNSYNHRIIYSEKELWDYMCGKELDSSKKIFDTDFDPNNNELIKISSRFDNLGNDTYNQLKVNNDKKNIFSNLFGLGKNKNKNKNFLEQNHLLNIKQVSMMDYLIFNPYYNLSYEDIGWMIQFCKYEKIKSYTDETYNIDGWFFDRLYYSDSSGPNYIIEYKGLNKSANITKLQLESSKDENKRNILRFAIQLGNESPDKYINFYNYYMISQWYDNYDGFLQSSRMVNGSINYYLEELEKKNKIALEHDDLVIRLDNKLTKKELIYKLYFYSERDQLTNYNMLLKETKSNTQIDLTPWEKLDFIEKILDTQINTELNLFQLNLTGFLKFNGKINTVNLINSIKSIIKYRFNVHNVSKLDKSLIYKEELLAGMYNIAGPTGMGIFQSSNKTMSKNETAKLLENNEYFDYLNGVRMKTSFELFPIMDYKYYDESQGDGTFLMVIYNLTRGNKIEKEKLSREKILEQIEKMII
jgi:hypothetical protein